MEKCSSMFFICGFDIVIEISIPICSQAFSQFILERLRSSSFCAFVSLIYPCHLDNKIFGHKSTAQTTELTVQISGVFKLC